MQNKNILKELLKTILERKNNYIKESYTCYLFDKGIDKILKKIGEETSEVIIAAKNNQKEELVYELADLVYHCLVLLAEKDISLIEIEQELQKRQK